MGSLNQLAITAFYLVGFPIPMYYHIDDEFFDDML